MSNPFKLLQDALGGPGRAAAEEHARQMRDAYLELIAVCLINTIYEDPPALGGDTYKPAVRELGLDVPSRAHSMIGKRRMLQLRFVCEDVIARDIPGDFIETGAWRGGACIFMRAILRAHFVTDRTVWVADSFAGLPAPDAEKYPADAGDQLHSFRELAVTLETVQDNFRRYGLLDSQVRFLKGWFKDTLATAPIERLAVLRLDGDMYESTVDALAGLYHRLSPGGYVVVDDYEMPSCRSAVTDFRAARGIRDELHDIDGSGVFWQKLAA